jgi:hypothetical protein
LHLPRCCAARQLTIASLVLSPRCLPTTNQRHTRDRHPARLRKSNGWATARYRSPVGRRPNCRSSSRSSSRPRPGDPTLTPQQEGPRLLRPGPSRICGEGYACLDVPLRPTLWATARGRDGGRAPPLPQAYP